METEHLRTVRTYWDASARNDYELAGQCVGEGYLWIDHTFEVEARTPDELRKAMNDDSAWSNRTFAINNAMETTDGALVVQATETGTLTAPWRSVEARGQTVSHDGCWIFRFDGDGRIIHEEKYSDASSWMVRLRATG
jgi:hypothetical protein